MLDALSNYRHQSPSGYERRMHEQYAASELAARAVRDQSTSLLVRALTEQRLALQALGRDAGVPIVTDEVAALAEAAISEAAAVLPAGAGGGDVAIFVAAHPPSERLKHLAESLNHKALPLNLGVRGVHSASAGC